MGVSRDPRRADGGRGGRAGHGGLGSAPRRCRTFTGVACCRTRRSEVLARRRGRAAARAAAGAAARAAPSPSPVAPRNCRGWRSPSSAASSSATRSGSAVGTAPSSAISSSSVRTTCSESGGTVDGTGAAGSSDPPVAGIWTPQGGAQAREVVVEKLASARGVGHDSEATCRVGSAFHPSPLLRAPYRRSDPGV